MLFKKLKPCPRTTFPVGAGGALGTAVTTTITGAVSLTSVTVAPSGNFIYIVDQDDVGPGTVYAYSLSGGTIGTTALNSQPTGIGPSGVAIDPTGKILTINNNADDTISTYTIDSTGKLTPTTPATVAADTATWWTTFLVTAQ